MGHTVRYTGTRRERRAAALRDAHEWLNAKQWCALIAIIRETRDSAGIRQAIRTGRLAATFTGMRGAPAEAVIMFALRPKGHWMKAP